MDGLLIASGIAAFAVIGLVGVTIRAKSARVQAQIKLEKEASNLVRLREALALEKRQREQLESRLHPILDAETHAAEFRAVHETEKSALAQERDRISSEIKILSDQYATGFTRYETLKSELQSLEENLEDVSFGFYRPHFTYAASEEYKAAIEDIRDVQKQMIKNRQAAFSGTAWVVGGSKVAGERMVKQYQKLILRAFNAESEAAIANVSWNNFRVMQTRVEKAFELLNKLGSEMQIGITERYRDVRMAELRLVYEAAEKKQKEREARRLDSASVRYDFLVNR
jgi:hypothetical protein